MTTGPRARAACRCSAPVTVTPLPAAIRGRTEKFRHQPALVAPVGDHHGLRITLRGDARRIVRMRRLMPG